MTDITTFEEVRELATRVGVGVKLLPDSPGWCRLAMPSRITPTRRMPPLKLSTAKKILNEELALRPAEEAAA